jgi:hypothetical protein
VCRCVNLNYPAEFWSSSKRGAQRLQRAEPLVDHLRNTQNALDGVCAAATIRSLDATEYSGELGAAVNERKGAGAMALGVSRPDRSTLSGSTGLRQSATCGLLACFVCVISTTGCGVVSWEPALQEAHELSAVSLSMSAPLTGETSAVLAAAFDDPISEATEAAPSFEVMVGFTNMFIGDKLAGTNNNDNDVNSEAESMSWDDAFDYESGLDVQVVLSRPPRSVDSMAAGDTLMIARVTLDSYTGQVVELGDANALPATNRSCAYGGMSILGVWLDGKTVFNPIGKARKARAYLQYGGGMSQISQVDRTDSSGTGEPNNWASTVALGFHMALGLEVRVMGNLGIYLEAGVQDIKKPNLEEGAAAERQAQDLLEYPLRLGVMVVF